MLSVRLLALTSLTMIAFAANSLFCRAALAGTNIDAASFTTIRLLSGAIALWLISWGKNKTPIVRGDWSSALALFCYAAGFSFAYIELSAGTGALLLFGAVQITMIGFGLLSGERINWRQTLGFILAFTGLAGLMAPGLQAPPLLGSILMLAAGISWGVYSLRGRGAGDATQKTAGNFLRAVLITAVLSLVFHNQVSVDLPGFGLALASGALASGVGYAIWYTVLPELRATIAATVQLSVPILAAFGGVLLLSETVTLRLFLASVAVLGGIAIFILSRSQSVGD